MKNIIIGIIALFILSCSKDEISKKDRKNDCKNCTLYTYRNDSLIAQFKYDDFITHLGTSDQWCNYLDTISKGPFIKDGQKITRNVDCN